MAKWNENLKNNIYVIANNRTVDTSENCIYSTDIMKFTHYTNVSIKSRQLLNNKKWYLLISTRTDRLFTVAPKIKGCIYIPYKFSWISYSHNAIAERTYELWLYYIWSNLKPYHAP